MSREHPILFSGDMVRAIIDDRKTQTRRVMKPQPEQHSEYEGGFRINCGRTSSGAGTSYVAITQAHCVCPYGSPGDLLWVRETWWQPPAVTRRMLIDGADTWPKIEYDQNLTEPNREEFRAWGWKRRPSIHMPRWASRITLCVTGVRIERLQEISTSDAMAEGLKIVEFSRPPRLGVPGISAKVAMYGESYGKSTSSAVRAFRSLWDSINAKRGHGWDANPWVWVIEFEVVKQ